MLNFNNNIGLCFICPHCNAFLKKKTKFCTECGAKLIDDEPAAKIPPVNNNPEPGTDIPIIAEYFHKSVALVNNDSSYEIILSYDSGDYAQLDVYTKASDRDPEIRKTYKAPVSAVNTCLDIIAEYNFEAWNECEDTPSICGGGYTVIKFRKGDSLIRVSSDKMPPDGNGKPEVVRDYLSSLIDESNLIGG